MFPRIREFFYLSSPLSFLSNYLIVRVSTGFFPFQINDVFWKPLLFWCFQWIWKRSTSLELVLLKIQHAICSELFWKKADFQQSHQ